MAQVRTTTIRTRPDSLIKFWSEKAAENASDKAQLDAFEAAVRARPGVTRFDYSVAGDTLTLVLEFDTSLVEHPFRGLPEPYGSYSTSIREYYTVNNIVHASTIENI